MAHIERLTDVPEDQVATVKDRLEQRGATVTVTKQADGLFTVEGLHPDRAGLEAAAPAPTPTPTPVPAPVPTRAAAAALAEPALTDTQARTVKAIVNVFETGEVLGDYGEVTLIPGDTGHLTYGRSQTTLGSGLLHELIARYAANAGARFGARLRAYLPRLAERDVSLDRDAALHNLLRAAADDPVMRETQDRFFDDRYWAPALAQAGARGLTAPLSVAVVYDSRVHGSWELIRDRTDDAVGRVADVGERRWVGGYVAQRHQWLASHPRDDLRRTVYRMDAFQRLIDQDRWGLALPLVVRGEEISSLSLSGQPPGCYDGPAPGTRALAISLPLTRGLDVRLMQLALSDAGLPVKADGVFGQASSEALKRHQADRGLPVTGAADAAQVAALASAVLA